MVRNDGDGIPISLPVLYRPVGTKCPMLNIVHGMTSGRTRTATTDAESALRSEDSGMNDGQGVGLEMSSSEAGTCEVDVFEGYDACPNPGTTLYARQGYGPDRILVCVEHAKSLAADEFGEVVD